MLKVFTKNPQKVPFADPTVLARFSNLEMVSRLIVEGFIMGMHKSPYKGASIEFVEHRQYYPGDEIRHIDWRAYGKTGKYYIKEYEDETNLRCYLIVDASGSMGYAKETISKFDYSRLLAAALGYLLLSQRDATGLITYDKKVRDRFDPSSNPQNFQRLVKILEGRKTGGETSLSLVLEKLIPTLKRRSLIVLISDCFDRVDAFSSALKQLRHNRHEVILFHVVAPEEEEFPFNKPTMFRSLELESHRKLVDPMQLRKHYLQQYSKFCEQLEKRSIGMGVDYHKMTTKEPYHTALGAFLDDRSRQKSKRYKR